MGIVDGNGITYIKRKTISNKFLVNQNILYPLIIIHFQNYAFIGKII